jgi:hypothetical protein
MVTNGRRSDTLRGDLIRCASTTSDIAVMTVKRPGWLAANWLVRRSQFATFGGLLNGVRGRRA